MAQRLYSVTNYLNEQDNQTKNRGNKAEFVNLKPDAATGETVCNLRIIGFPIRFRQFSNRKPDMEKRAQGDKGATKQVPFPDAHLTTNAYTRIGTDNDPAYGECPWQKMGYIGSDRFAVNVLERKKDGTSVVKILEKGKMIFEKFMEYEASNREINTDNPDEDPLCVMLGGPVAHDVKIKAKSNPKALGGVDYVVSINPRPSVVTEEEIEMLRAVGTPKTEDLDAERAAFDKIRKGDPQLPEWQDWYLYGYNVSNIFKHTPVRTEAAGTSAPAVAAESTDSDELVLDDEEPAPVATTKAKSKKTAPAQELSNPFNEDDEEAELVAAGGDDPDWD
jgi:hypothetical protein